MTSPPPSRPRGIDTERAGVDLHDSTHLRVTEFLGIYHADGGPIGEAKYILGKLLGTAHCALCDITHSPIRRKPAWDAMVARLGVPFRLLHLNEMPPDVSQAVASAGSPAVLARLDGRALAVALHPDTLDGLAGSVDAFDTALRRFVTANGWLMGPTPPQRTARDQPPRSRSSQGDAPIA